MGANRSIDSIGNLNVAARTDYSTLSLTYSDASYQARVDYTLTGNSSGSGKAILGETATFFNNSGSDLVLRFFDYSDFDIGGIAGGQSVTLSQTQLGSVYKTRFVQTLGAFSVTSTAASGTNSNTQMEANAFSATLQNLTNGSPTSLNGVLLANGDVTAGAEWDVTLAAGRSLQLSKTFTLVVPEPSSAAVMGLGLVAWAVARSKRTRLMGSASK